MRAVLAVALLVGVASAQVFPDDCPQRQDPTLAICDTQECCPGQGECRGEGGCTQVPYTCQYSECSQLFEGNCRIFGDNTACDDGVQCTDNLCYTGAFPAPPATGADPITGCYFAVNDDNCVDNDPYTCTSAGCSAILGCVSVPFNSACADAYSCTIDRCIAADVPGVDQTTGCSHTPSSARCNNANECSVGICDPADPMADSEGCVYVPNPLLCDDGIACTDNVCDVDAGCLFVPVDSNCNSPAAPCQDGVCTATGCQYVNNDDNCIGGVGCNILTCDPSASDADPQGCSAEAIDFFCDDLLPCTVEFCDSTQDPPKCMRDDSACNCDCLDDGADCTIDTCELTYGMCTHQAQDEHCDDNIDCTVDKCVPFKGCTHDPMDKMCDDGHECTFDFCDPLEGCVNLPFGCEQRSGELCVEYSLGEPDFEDNYSIVNGNVGSSVPEDALAALATAGMLTLGEDLVESAVYFQGFERTFENAPVVVATLARDDQNDVNSEDSTVVLQVVHVETFGFWYVLHSVGDVENPDLSDYSITTVSYIAMEEGVNYVDGKRVEARRLISRESDFAGSWIGQPINLSDFEEPIVYGAVQTLNNAQWTVFWTSHGTDVAAPPSAHSARVGKHVGSTEDATRQTAGTEVIGVIIMERGLYTVEYTSESFAPNDLKRDPSTVQDGATAARTVRWLAECTTQTLHCHHGTDRKRINGVQDIEYVLSRWPVASQDYDLDPQLAVAVTAGVRNSYGVWAELFTLGNAQSQCAAGDEWGYFGWLNETPFDCSDLRGPELLMRGSNSEFDNECVPESVSIFAVDVPLSVCQDCMCSEDGIACTVDECHPVTGDCQHRPSNWLCNDNIACTFDVCDVEEHNGCTHKPNNRMCDDGIDCTIDVCDPLLGCTHDDTPCQCCLFVDGTTLDANHAHGKERPSPFNPRAQLLDTYAFPTEAFTVDFWVQVPDQERHGGTIISYRSSNAECNEFAVMSTACLTIHINNFRWVTEVSIQDGQWHHVAITWHKDGQMPYKFEQFPGVARLYVDGMLAATRRVAGSENVSIPSPGSLFLGQDADRVDGKFQRHQSFIGLVDEVRVWDHERTLAQIDAAAGERIEDGNGLVSAWYFDCEHRGADSSSNGFDLELVEGAEATQCQREAVALD